MGFWKELFEGLDWIDKIVIVFFILNWVFQSYQILSLLYEKDIIVADVYTLSEISEMIDIPIANQVTSLEIVGSISEIIGIGVSFLFVFAVYRAIRISARKQFKKKI